MDYLEAHPDAADSLTGIHQWWLPGRQLDAGITELKAALDRLVQRGEIRRSTLPDGTQVYSRASGRSNRDDPESPPGDQTGTS